MRWLRVLGYSVAAIAAIGLAAYFGVRLHDGPVGPLPGGPLAAGELVEVPPSDWTFAKDLAEIELQLESQKISRTTWILVRDGVAYIPCSLSFPPGKSWYVDAQSDGRAILRIEGRRHRVVLVRDDDPTLVDFARAEIERNYGAPPPGDGGALFFRVSVRG
ncbi:hypothetical protein K2X89_04990 [Myxococcota bacterium]|nr:hypothetical protein [Myxococcota bacterium]